MELNNAAWMKCHFLRENTHEKEKNMRKKDEFRLVLGKKICWNGILDATSSEEANMYSRGNLLDEWTGIWGWQAADGGMTCVRHAGVLERIRGGKSNSLSSPRCVLVGCRCPPPGDERAIPDDPLSSPRCSMVMPNPPKGGRIPQYCVVFLYTSHNASW